MLLRIVLAALLLSITLAQPATARTPIPVAAPTSAKEESDRLRADMEGQVERLRLNVETFMQTQDKRIGDLTFFANFNNAFIAILAIVIGVAVAVFGFRFPKMAMQEAKRTVDEWVGQEGKQHLDARFHDFKAEMHKTFRADLALALDAFRDEVAPHVKKVQESCALVDTMREKAASRETARTPNEPAGSASEIARDPDKLRAAAGKAQAAPDAERTFDDWYLMAWAAVEEGEDSMAFNRFAKARAAGTTDRLLALKAAYNGAMAAYRLSRWKDAIAFFDASIAQWEQGGVADGEILVIEAFLYKCNALFSMEKLQDMLDTANAALEMDWNAGDPDIANRRLLLEFKKGVALHGLSRDEEAEVQYDGFISRCGNVDDTDLRSEYISALFNKMLLRRKANDTAEQKRLLDEIENRSALVEGDSHVASVAGQAKAMRRALEAESQLVPV